MEGPDNKSTKQRAYVTSKVERVETLHNLETIETIEAVETLERLNDEIGDPYDDLDDTASVFAEVAAPSLLPFGLPGQRPIGFIPERLDPEAEMKLNHATERRAQRKLKVTRRVNVSKDSSKKNLDPVEIPDTMSTTELRDLLEVAPPDQEGEYDLDRSLSSMAPTNEVMQMMQRMQVSLKMDGLTRS